MSDGEGVPQSLASIRNQSSRSSTDQELAYTMASEALATERIEDQDAQGYSACRQETSLAARSIKGAIESDRKDWQQLLLR